MEAEQESASRCPRARRSGLLRSLRRSFSWKCSLCSAIVVVCISYFLFCHFQHGAYDASSSLIFSHGPCSQGYNLLPIVIGLLLYIVYLAECWRSRAKLYHLKRMSLDESLSFLQQLRDASPQVWWKAVCYHYARRTRHVTRYRNGEAMNASQVYYERVDTLSAEDTFLYDSCGVKDISGWPLGLADYSVCRVYISRAFAFASSQAAREFEEQRARFFDEHETADDYLEVREGMQLDAPVQHLLCILDKSRRLPWFLNPMVFWFFSIFLLSWPIRFLAEWRTAHLHFRVTKLFGTNYLSPSSLNYTGPLTRCSSITSSRLQEEVLCRPLLLPSYSMAMLGSPLSPLHLQRPSLGYGSVVEPPPPLLAPPRSTSFNLFSRRPSHEVLRRPPRSRSFGWSNPWGDIAEEHESLIASDNPPPYEVALRLCAPLYERMRDSMARLHSAWPLKTVTESNAH